MPDLYYRVCVLDPFRNLDAFLEFRIYGICRLEILGVSITKSSPAPHKASDAIGVYVNFELKCESKTRAQAVEMLKAILGQCPDRAKKAVLEFGRELIDAIS